jgi:hypothetical protein
MEDVIRLRGCLEIVLGDQYGNVIDKQIINNTIVTAGRKWVLQQIASSEMNTAQSIAFIGLGTGTASPATGDTALVSEVTRSAIQSFSTANLTSNPPSWRAEASWATNLANTTLAEVALFVVSSGGTMLGRATFSTVNKTTSNTFSISYTVSN